MANKKIGIGLFTVFLGVLAAICLRLSPIPESIPELPLKIWAQGKEKQELIEAWTAEDGTVTVFLPSWAKLSDVRMQAKGTVLLADEVVTQSADWGVLEYDIMYPLSINEENLQIRFLHPAQLPSVHVDTRSGDNAYLHAQRENSEPGSMRIYQSDGSVSYNGSLAAFGGRGNATWELEKKPYKLELKQDADLLEMGAARNWVLLANDFDPTNIRNKAVLETAQAMNLAYTPDSQWVELYVNGEYMGLYLLCEKNEIHPQRVDLNADTASMVSIEKEDRLWEYADAFVTDGGIPVRVRAGDLNAAQEKLRSVENAILNESGIDPISGYHWTQLIDLESWARKYLLEEVFGNLDAGSISQFFYWEGDGPVYAGPAWDYDITMGNPNNWQLESPQMLFAGRPNLWKPGDTPWYYALYAKPEFRSRVIALYETEFRPLLEELLETELKAYQEQIAVAAQRNALRWNKEDPDTATAYMATYMNERMAFLDSLWLKHEHYHTVLVYIQEHVMACYAVKDGECIPERSVPGGNDVIFYEGWYDYATDEPVDFSKPIREDTLIYLKEINLLKQSMGEEEGLSLKALVTYCPAAALLGMLTILLTIDGRKRKNHTDITPVIVGGELDGAKTNEVSS